MVTVARPSVVVVSKLRQKDLGNPKMAAALPEGDQRVVWLGTIIGKASGVKRFVDPKDETIVSWALTGVFEGQPLNLDAGGNPIADQYKKPILRSGICWLPGGVHEMVVDAVTNGDPTTRGLRNVVPLRVKIGTRRASNAAGYEYVNELESEITSAADPLADLRGDAPALLTDQTAAVEMDQGDASPADPEPVPAAHGSKRRK